MNDPNARAARAERRAAWLRRAEDRRRAGRDARWRRELRRLRRTLARPVVHTALPALLTSLSRTWRYEVVGREHFTAVRDGCLIALWHGRMLPVMPLHRRDRFAVLVSPSRDGDLIRAVLERIGYTVIRGSTSRTGARALREMRAAAAEGRPVAITPDGPRGPRHSTNVGLAWLARETRLPIVTIAVGCAPAWRLRSWDRLVVPKPFARIAVRYGEPLHVAPSARDVDLESATEGLRAQLLREEAAAFATLGAPPDW